MTVDWYVIHVRTDKERAVSDALQRKGVEVFLPMELKIIRPQNKRRIVARPLFRRYLFVAIDSDEPTFSEIRKTDSVDWFVTNADKPVRIRTCVVNELMSAEEAGLFDSTQPKPKPDLPLQKGDRARFTNGPFTDLVVEILAASSEKRIEVVMSTFGRPTKMTTTLSNLEKVP